VSTGRCRRLPYSHDHPVSRRSSSVTHRTIKGLLFAGEPAQSVARKGVRLLTVCVCVFGVVMRFLLFTT